MSRQVPRDIVTTRFLFNLAKRNMYIDTARDAVVGDYKWSANASFLTPLNGWLLCDGSLVSITTYANLYAIIGTQFGGGAGTFKLPDCRGRVPATVGQGPGLTARTIGNVTGAETHVLTLTEMPLHNHAASSDNQGSHNHGGTQAAGNHTHGVSDPGHTHSQVTNNDDYNATGGVPPGFVEDNTGNSVRTWDNINRSTTGISINGVGDHTHAISTDGGHAHNLTVAQTGGHDAVNLFQPTIFIGSIFIYSGVMEPHCDDAAIVGNNETEYPVV